MGIETFKVNLSGSVAAGGTFLVPYPSGMSATNYVTTDAKMVDSAGNVYDATVLLGAGGVTVTNPTGRVIGQKDMGHLQLTTDDVGPANSDVTGGPVYANAAGTALVVGGDEYGLTATTTWAARPSPTDAAGRMIYVSDVGPGGSLWVSNGLRWCPVNGRVRLHTQDTDATTQATATTKMSSFLLPAGVMQNGDILEFRFTAQKSGTAETATLQLRFGSTDSASDASLFGTSPLATTQISLGAILDVRRNSATTLQKLANGQSLSAAYSGTTSIALHAPVTIDNLDSNNIYCGVYGLMSVGSEILTLRSWTCDLACAA